MKNDEKIDEKMKHIDEKIDEKMMKIDEDKKNNFE